MKANELMIGDWVLYNPNVFIEDEYESTKDCYPTKISCGEDIDLAIEDCYSPIPLTAEILKKNGFEKRNGEYQDVFYYYEDFDLLIDDRLEPCGYTLYGVFGFQIKYVHELQHAMKLRGIEKEIEL